MRPALFVFAVLALAVAVSSTTTGFNYESRNSYNRDSLRLIGDVNDVLQGRVLPGFENEIWPAPKIGFGAATLGALSAEGEAFFANGYAFVRQTDNTTANYYQTISGESFRTPFSIVVPDHLRPDGIGSYFSNAANAITFAQLYNEIYAAVEGSPFCFWGFADFTYVNAIAVSKAPVWGEPLFGATKASYYSQPNFNLTNVHALAFGCAANYSSFNDAALANQLGKALYLNPLDPTAATALQNHAHIITVDDSVNDLDDVHPSKVTGVYHLLTDAKINFIQAKVFKIDNVGKMVTITDAPTSAAGY